MKQMWMYTINYLFKSIFCTNTNWTSSRLLSSAIQISPDPIKQAVRSFSEYILYVLRAWWWAPTYSDRRESNQWTIIIITLTLKWNDLMFCSNRWFCHTLIHPFSFFGLIPSRFYSMACSYRANRANRWINYRFILLLLIIISSYCSHWSLIATYRNWLSIDSSSQ